jgi:hypothetical protein
MLFLIPLAGPIAGASLLPTALSFLINGQSGFAPSFIVGILLFGLIF